MFSNISGLDVLSEGTALGLLAGSAVGRIAYSERAMPFVTPVNFVLDGMDVVIRTGSHSGPALNAPGQVVAFEVDDIDVAEQCGWIVVATGLVQLVRDIDELARLGRLELRSWPREATDCYLRMRIDVVRGHRVADTARAVTSS